MTPLFQLLNVFKQVFRLLHLDPYLRCFDSVAFDGLLPWLCSFALLLLNLLSCSPI